MLFVINGWLKIMDEYYFKKMILIHADIACHELSIRDL